MLALTTFIFRVGLKSVQGICTMCSGVLAFVKISDWKAVIFWASIELQRYMHCETVYHFENKERLGNVVFYVTEYTIRSIVI
jgi:hypothetical protein